MVISSDYYLNDNVLYLAQNLIGKYIFTQIDGQIAGGIITETEAYQGITDKASHAFGGRRTQRNEMMYARGGVIYVYMCYGVHFLLNIVTNQRDIPDAILIRSIFPTHGEELMLKRTGKLRVTPDLAQGPGKVSKCLGISKLHNGISLNSDMVWLENRDLDISPEDIIATPRIGVDYAAEDALRPNRFYLSDYSQLIDR